jgi:hypothetical protein
MPEKYTIGDAPKYTIGDAPKYTIGEAPPPQGDAHDYDPSTNTEGIYGLKDQSGRIHWTPYSGVPAAQQQGMKFAKPEYEQKYTTDRGADQSLDQLKPQPTSGERLRDFFLHPMNASDDASHLIMRPKDASVGELAGTDLYNAAAAATGVFRHPIDTGVGILNSIGGTLLSPMEKVMHANGIDATKQETDPMTGEQVTVPKLTVPEEMLKDATENGPQFGSSMIGQSVALGAVPHLLDIPGVDTSLNWAGDKMQGGAANIMNHVAGSRKGDFGLGGTSQNPGRGYFQAMDLAGDSLPWYQRFGSLTKGSLADKVKTLQDTVGRKIGETLNTASKPHSKYSLEELPDSPGDIKDFWLAPSEINPAYRPIPADAVRSAIYDPINKAQAVLNGPFGGGDAALLDRKATFEPHLGRTVTGRTLLDFDDNGLVSNVPTADTYYPHTMFDPRQVWEIKKNVGDNVSWTDPTGATGLKDVGQQIAGGLGDLLNKSVPEVAPLNEAYHNIDPLTKRTRERANTGSVGGTELIRRLTIDPLVGGAAGTLYGHTPESALGGALLSSALDTLPVKTTLASSLWNLGKGLKGLGDLKDTPPPLDWQGSGAQLGNLFKGERGSLGGDEPPHDPSDLTSLDTHLFDSLTDFGRQHGVPATSKETVVPKESNPPTRGGKVLDFIKKFIKDESGSVNLPDDLQDALTEFWTKDGDKAGAEHTMNDYASRLSSLQAYLENQVQKAFDAGDHQLAGLWAEKRDGIEDMRSVIHHALGNKGELPPAEGLYDLNKDPMGLKKIAFQPNGAMKPNGRTLLKTRLLDAGYSGYRDALGENKYSQREIDANRATFTDEE